MSVDNSPHFFPVRWDKDTSVYQENNLLLFLLEDNIYKNREYRRNIYFAICPPKIYLYNFPKKCQEVQPNDIEHGYVQ